MMCRIVAAFPAAPHPFGNTAARWFYVLVRELLAQGHEMVCLTVTEEPVSFVEESKGLLAKDAKPGQLTFRVFSAKPGCNLLVRKMRNAWRPFSEFLYADGLRETIGDEVRRGYDILHLEQLWTGWVGLGMPRTLLNIHHFELIDWEDRELRSFGERKAWLQMRRATLHIVRHMGDMRVFTQRLLEKARTINPAARYWVVPFALDLSLYPVQPLMEEPIVGLVGSMHWFPTRSAGERLLTRIWPLVKKQYPAAKLHIAGWNACRYLGRYLPSPDVVLEENIAHPKDFFSKVAVMVYAPSRGSGMKIKVLESMAYGVPVVTTWEGVEGIDYQNGVHCWVEEDDEMIAARVSALLEEPLARKQMREAARALMEAQYSPKPVVGRMLDVYGEVKRS